MLSPTHSAIASIGCITSKPLHQNPAPRLGCNICLSSFPTTSRAIEAIKSRDASSVKEIFFAIDPHCEIHQLPSLPFPTRHIHRKTDLWHAVQYETLQGYPQLYAFRHLTPLCLHTSR